MCKSKKILRLRSLSLQAIVLPALCISSVMSAHAATLGQRAVYSVNILVGGDATEVGQCSGFTFGDVSLICADTKGPLVDNVSLPKAGFPDPSPVLSGGDGILDTFAGTFIIQTGKADATGNNTFTLNAFQMDPYLATSGGTFKTTMTAPDGALSTGGTVSAVGEMVLDSTGRTGVAAFFETSIGIANWNFDDSTTISGNGDPVTSLWVPFTTGSSSSFEPAIPGAIAFTVTGRPVGDANTDGILDAILVSAGNIGQVWTGFDGVPYSEAMNVQFVLVSADPVAVDDAFTTKLLTDLTIDIKNDLIVTNDTIADKTETLTFLSLDTTLTDAGSTVAEIGGIITYTPNPAFTDSSTDSFTYTITDGNGDTDTATVIITITNAGPPIAENDAVAATEDTPVTFDPVAGSVATLGVIDDSDPVPAEISGLTISAFDAVSGQGGAITQSGNDLTYTPAPNFAGVDTFTYTIENSIPLTDIATVTVTVAAVNDAPVCTDVDFTTAVDTSLDINIANDLLSTSSQPPLCTDVEDNSLSLASFDSAGSNGGAITNTVAGVLQYTPVAGFTGTETFTFTATDGTDNAVPNTVTVNVFSANLGNFTMLDKGGNVFGGTNDVAIEWDEISTNSINIDANGIATDTDFGKFITVASSTRFNGFNWTANRVRVFKNTTAAPITLKFDVTCTAADYDSGKVDCSSNPLGDQDAIQRYMTLTLEPNQVGVHILFDWNLAKNIDVALAWKEDTSWNTYGKTAPTNQLWLGNAGVPPSPTTDWRFVSSDVPNDGTDGINGTPMVDGAFIGFYANFNYKPGTAGEKLPPVDTEISDVEVGGFSMGIWSLMAGLFSVFGLRRINNKK